MPLSKERDRERKRLQFQPKSNLNVIPNSNLKLQTVGLTLEGNKIVGVTKGAMPLRFPVYNPVIHKAGDRVKMFDGNKMTEMVVPDLDADGVPLGASSISLKSTFNPFTPSFRPNPKPIKKVKKGKQW